MCWLHFRTRIKLSALFHYTNYDVSIALPDMFICDSELSSKPITGDTRPTSCRTAAHFCRLLPIYLYKVHTAVHVAEETQTCITHRTRAHRNSVKPLSIFCKESTYLFSSKSFIHFSVGQCVAMSRPTINNFLSKLEYLHTCEFGLYNHFKIFVKTSFYNLPTRVHLQFVLDTQGTFFGLRLYPARVLCLGQKGYNHRLTVPYRVPLSPSL